MQDLHEERNQNLQKGCILKPTVIDFKSKQNLQEEQVLTDLLEEYRDIFASRLQELGQTYLAKHLINAGIAAPVSKYPYRVSPKR